MARRTFVRLGRLLPLPIAALAMAAEPAFRVPSEEERRRAIGALDALPEALRRALDPGDGFSPLPAPGPSDWLANHPESGQTFEGFVAAAPNRPDRERRVLGLRPLGAFPEGRSPPLETLRDLAAASFGLEARVLPAMEIREGSFTMRRNPRTRNRQVLSTDVLDALASDLPADAFCVLALTMEDLYPAPAWNFVFGQASTRPRVGVFSFARYDPSFYGGPAGRDYAALLMRRSAKVLVHETGHMFGMDHCVYFECVMNGSNHLGETDARPLPFCPVCLRKLQWSVGFDVLERERKLLDLYRRCGLEEEAAWTERRITRIDRTESDALPKTPKP